MRNASIKYGSLRHRLGSKRGFQAMIGGNRVSLLHDGEQCFPAMLEAIEGAGHEILLEMYWFGSDRTGWRFADALIRKARDGVNVRVIYDAVGSWESSEDLFDALRAAGCQVHEFHPIAPWRQRFNLGVVNHRDHRKMLVVDGRIGFTGGVNIGDPWAPPADGGQGWRDDMIRVEGPAVEPMRELFRQTWAVLESPASLPQEPPPRIEGPGETPVRVLANHYLGERRAIREVYLERIERARERIFLTNSYFVPDRAVRRALGRAAERGVDVCVLLPGESDLPMVQLASRYAYGGLLRRGVALHEWQGAVLHAKSAVIDGRWCAVGSYNLDWRSWRFNLELIVTVEDARLGRAMEARFRRDLDNAWPVNPSDWRYRPLSQRMGEWFFYLFRKLL